MVRGQHRAEGVLGRFILRREGALHAWVFVVPEQVERGADGGDAFLPPFEDDEKCIPSSIAADISSMK